MEAGPFGRTLQFCDVPRPHLVGPDRQELGLGVDRMDSLTPALAGLALGGQEQIHGTDRAMIAAFIEQCGEHRGRRHVRKALAVEKAQQQILLGDRERQRGPRPRLRYAPLRGHAVPGAIAVHEPAVQRERLTGTAQADVWSELSHGEHHASPLVSSAVGSPSATHSFFWASMISSAGSSWRRSRTLWRCSCWICRAGASGLAPRLFGPSAV